MSETRAPRRVVIDTIKAAVKALRAGRYSVRSGPVNWAIWDYDAEPYGCAVVTDEVLFRRHKGEAHAKISLEFSCRWPDPTEPEFSDDLIDELEFDAIEIINAVETSTDGRGDRVATVGESDVNFITFSDADQQVQGIVVQFEIHY